MPAYQAVRGSTNCLYDEKDLCCDICAADAMGIDAGVNRWDKIKD
jgi:hypothetical protein